MALLKIKPVFIFFFFLFTLLIFLHLNLIVHDPGLHYDDFIIVGPLFKIHHLSDYLDAIKRGLILDLQPVRDLSHFLDLKIIEIVPHYYSQHLINVLLWIFIVLYFYKITYHFKNYKDELSFSHLILVAFFALSPISTSSVAWIAARKHLLSTLFIFICTEEVTRLEQNNKYHVNNIKLMIFYTLSILSQPISLFWPAWYIVYLKLRSTIKISYIKIVPIFFIGIIVLASNFYYYNVFFQQIGHEKMIDLDFWDKITSPFLAIGRYFELILFPLSALPSPHSRDSVENLIGLVFLALSMIGAYFFNKKNNSRQSLLTTSFLYFLFLLAPVLIPTNIFCSDTYLLNPSLGILLIIFLMLQRYKALRYFFSLYLVFIFGYNLNYISNFNNQKRLWTYSFIKEPTNESIVALTYILLDDKKYGEAYQISRFNIAEKPASTLIDAHCKAIFRYDALRFDQKINELLEIKVAHPTKSLLLSILFLQQKNAKSFQSSVKEFSAFSNFYAFWKNGNKALALGMYLCQYSDNSTQLDCLQLIRSSIKQYPQYSATIFNETLNSLKLSRVDELIDKSGIFE